MSDVDDRSYGPELPPGYTVHSTSVSDVRKSTSTHQSFLPERKKLSNSSSSSDLDSDKCSSKEHGQSRNRKRKLKKEHQSFKKSKHHSSSSEDSDSDSCSKSDSNSSGDEYGPCIPPGYVKCISSVPEDSKPTARSFIGPVIPARGVTVSDSHLSDSHLSENEDIGPMPAEMTSGGSLQYSAHAIERRAVMMKERLECGNDQHNSSGPTVREEWMTELPSGKERSYDLVNRAFQKNPQKEVGDQSAWTDTPADRERKEKEKKDKEEKNSDSRAKEIVSHAESARDKYLTQKIEEYNKNKRPESLLDMHRKKKKKKEKKEKKDKKKKKKKHKGKHKEDTPTERRAFDRELDLQLDKRLTHAQKNSIIGNAQQLNSKFSYGRSKFL